MPIIPVAYVRHHQRTLRHWSTEHRNLEERLELFLTTFTHYTTAAEGAHYGFTPPRPMDGRRDRWQLAWFRRPLVLSIDLASMANPLRTGFPLACAHIVAHAEDGEARAGRKDRQGRIVLDSIGSLRIDDWTGAMTAPNDFHYAMLRLLSPCIADATPELPPDFYK